MDAKELNRHITKFIALLKKGDEKAYYNYLEVCDTLGTSLSNALRVYFDEECFDMDGVRRLTMQFLTKPKHFESMVIDNDVYGRVLEELGDRVDEDRLRTKGAGAEFRYINPDTGKPVADFDELVEICRIA